MYEEYLSKKESNVYGLKYIPSLEPFFSNSADYIPRTLEQITIRKSDGNEQFTFRNALRCLKEWKKIRKNSKCIVEIGVAYHFGGSSTELFLSKKKNYTHYFGIDIDMTNKIHHEEYKPNTHMLLMNSEIDKEKILEKMKEFGCESIDVLFIDGDHSINLMLNDWKYSELVVSGGLILIHDLNVHPGPHLVWDAIDENLFVKEKWFCDQENDFGLGVVWKK